MGDTWAQDGATNGVVESVRAAVEDVERAVLAADVPRRERIATAVLAGYVARGENNPHYMIAEALSLADAFIAVLDVS